MSARDIGFLPDFLSKPVTRRQVLGGAAVVGAGAALGPVVAACGGSSGDSSASPSAASSGTPKSGGALKVGAGAGSAKENLDIHAAALTNPALGMRLNMYDSLLEFDAEGVLGMALAEEMTPNDAATQFTVRLKSGLVFHNGQPVTADDLVYTFTRILDPKNPGLAALILRGLSPSGVKKVDDLTVSFNLDEPNAVFPEALANYATGIVPTGYDPKGSEGAIGTGPFKIETFLPGEKGVLAKNADYWREGPYVDQLSMIEFADATAQLNALLGGAIDYDPMLQGAQIKVAEGSGFKLLKADTGTWFPFTMHTKKKPFSDVRVRQAFRLIVDRPQMIAQAANGLQWVGNDMYAPFDPGYPSDLPQREQDLEQARSLLKSAGYDNDLTVTLTTSSSVAAVRLPRRQCSPSRPKEAGVTVKVNNVYGDVYWGEEYLSTRSRWTNGRRAAIWCRQPWAPCRTRLYNETHYDDPKWLSLVKKPYQTPTIQRGTSSSAKPRRWSTTMAATSSTRSTIWWMPSAAR